MMKGEIKEYSSPIIQMQEIDGSLFRPEKIKKKHEILTKLQKVT